VKADHSRLLVMKVISLIFPLPSTSSANSQKFPRVLFLRFDVCLHEPLIGQYSALPPRLFALAKRLLSFIPFWCVRMSFRSSGGRERGSGCCPTAS
jgi:hypothetical protein